MSRFDTIILGGGPAGAVAAYYLCKAGRSCLVLEAAGFARPRIGETFPPKLYGLLHDLGLWAAFESQEHLPAYGIVSSWGTTELDFNSHFNSIPGNGWHVNRSAFDEMLFREAQKAGAVCHMPCRITGLEQNQRGIWEITWMGDNGQQSATGTFLVNAAGRSNAYHERMGDQVEKYDTLVAVGAIVERKPDTANHALIEACPQGWWYSTPIPDNKTVLLLMTDLETVQSENLTEVSRWFDVANGTKWTKQRLLEDPASSISLMTRPAHSQLVTAVRQPAYLPAGDALASFDPLSGEGVIRAMQTALGVARTVQHWLDGERNATTGFLRDLAGLYLQYRQEAAAAYGREHRWPSAPFWAKRAQT